MNMNNNKTNADAIHGRLAEDRRRPTPSIVM